METGSTGATENSKRLLSEPDLDPNQFSSEDTAALERVGYPSEPLPTVSSKKQYRPWTDRH